MAAPGVEPQASEEEMEEAGLEMEEAGPETEAPSVGDAGARWSRGSRGRDGGGPCPGGRAQQGDAVPLED